MLTLKCPAQCYEWGRPAGTSEVAMLAEANGVDVDKSKPYAELWMGTHPNCPSRVESTGQMLSEWIEQNTSSVGDLVQRRFGATLPFLFKVLSVNKALSIQSHPDKQLAEKLHKEYPKLYADDNHKPEMALALSDDFEALCAFAPVSTILDALNAHPELAELVGNTQVQALATASEPDAQKKALRDAFTCLMTAPQPSVTEAVSRLVNRLRTLSESSTLSARDALALRLDSQYPGGDVGVMSAFFLNLVTLKAGQALYLGANEPHAYLAGELMECMASSDNVIRAGLTPKFKHAEVLCASLTYQTGLPDILEGDLINYHRVYRPPTEEFEMASLVLPEGVTTQLSANLGPQLLLVQHGKGRARASGPVTPSKDNGLMQETDMTRGKVLFIPAGTSVDLAADVPLTCWLASVNSTFFTLHSALESAEPIEEVVCVAQRASTESKTTSEVAQVVA